MSSLNKLLITLLLAVPLVTAASPLPLETVQDVPLPGHPTRFDYVSLDPKTGLLFIAHLGDDAVLVFDTRKNLVVATLPGIRRVHGVLAVPELGKVYASATGSNELVVIDEATLGISARIPAGVYPDGIAWVPHNHTLYVSDEHGKTDTVIDADHDRPVATVALHSEVGNSQYDPVTGHVLVAAQSSDAWIEIDATHHQILARHPLPGCQGPHGMTIAAQPHLAFIACSENNKLATLDLDTQRVTAWHDLGKDPDVLAIDPALKRLYVAAEDGTVSAFTLDERTTPLGAAKVADNAHSLAVDLASHQVYMPLMAVAGQPSLRILAPVPH